MQLKLILTKKFLKQIIISNGIIDFDVASINEVKLIKKLKPEANLIFYAHCKK